VSASAIVEMEGRAGPASYKRFERACEVVSAKGYTHERAEYESALFVQMTRLRHLFG